MNDWILAYLLTTLAVMWLGSAVAWTCADSRYRPTRTVGVIAAWIAILAFVWPITLSALTVFLIREWGRWLWRVTKSRD